MESAQGSEKASFYEAGIRLESGWKQACHFSDFGRRPGAGRARRHWPGRMGPVSGSHAFCATTRGPNGSGRSFQRLLCLTDAASRTCIWGIGRAPRRLSTDRTGEAPVAPCPVRSPGGGSRRARGDAPAPPDRHGPIGRKRPPALCGTSHPCGPLASEDEIRRPDFRGIEERDLEVRRAVAIRIDGEDAVGIAYLVRADIKGAQVEAVEAGDEVHDPVA